MRKEGECGDAVCIEYFARHFKVKIRLHTCLCKKPLQFPMLLEHKQEPIPVDGESFYRIAHMHVEPDQAQDWSGASGTVPGGVLSANGHYVPIWQASVRIAETPAGTPVWDEKEIEIGGESWADPVTGQEKKRRIDQNTQERGSARRDKIKHDQRTGLLSVVDDTNMTDATDVAWQDGEVQMIRDTLKNKRSDMSEEAWKDLVSDMAARGFLERSSEAVRQKGQIEQIREKQLCKKKYWVKYLSKSRENHISSTGHPKYRFGPRILKQSAMMSTKLRFLGIS